MPTENCIETMVLKNWIMKRITRFLTNEDWPRRQRRFKLRCSNKKHTAWRISFHKIHDRLSNFGSHLILNVN